MKRTIATLLLTMVLTAAAAGTAGAGTAPVRVTYLEGAAWEGPAEEGPWQPLSPAAAVPPGRFVRTGEAGIVELTLGDGSVVRLAPESLYTIHEAAFPEQSPRRFSAKLFFGKLWARIHKRSGTLSGRFETRIPTAVVGVRGTVYNLAAARDRSADIFVYDGRVGVGPPVLAPGAAREEVAWPAEVTEAEWEEIILGKLQRLRIGTDGRPGAPEAFAPEAVRDAWVEFNQRRDAGS